MILGEFVIDYSPLDGYATYIVVLITPGYVFIERKGGAQKHCCERAARIGCLPGIQPSTQVCALTGNRTETLWVHGTVLQPAEPPGRAIYILYICQIRSAFKRSTYLEFCKHFLCYLLKNFVFLLNSFFLIFKRSQILDF